MWDGQPLSTWQQCKAIAEILATGNDTNAARQRVRNAVLDQLAATGGRGVVLAAKLSRTDGPVPMEPGDAEVLEAMQRHGVVVSDGEFALEASLWGKLPATIPLP